MKIRNPFKGLFRKKSHEISLRTHERVDFFPLIGFNFEFGKESKSFLTEAYGMNPYVYMVIDRITSRSIQIPVNYVRKSDDSIEIENDELSELMANPNIKEDRGEFLYRVKATFLAAGECFIIKTTNEEGEMEIFCPVNYNVIINQNSKGEVISYTVTHFGNTNLYLPFEVLHIFKPDITIDTNYGFSSLRAGRKVYESNNEVWASEASLHRNKGVSGVLFAKGDRILDPKEKRELQDQYDEEYTGTGKFGKVKVSSTELGYKQMGMNPNDLKSVETRIEHLRTICALYNVDPKLFGDSAASTYNNLPSAEKALILNAVIPLCNKIYPKLIAFIGKDFGEFDITTVVDKSEIPELNAPNIELSNKIIAEVNAGILTPEQGNEILYPQGL